MTTATTMTTTTTTTTTATTTATATALGYSSYSDISVNDSLSNMPLQGKGGDESDDGLMDSGLVKQKETKKPLIELPMVVKRCSDVQLQSRPSRRNASPASPDTLLANTLAMKYIILDCEIWSQVASDIQHALYGWLNDFCMSGPSIFTMSKAFRAFPLCHVFAGSMTTTITSATAAATMATAAIVGTPPSTPIELPSSGSILDTVAIATATATAATTTTTTTMQQQLLARKWNAMRLRDLEVVDDMLCTLTHRQVDETAKRLCIYEFNLIVAFLTNNAVGLKNEHAQMQRPKSRSKAKNDKRTHSGDDQSVLSNFSWRSRSSDCKRFATHGDIIVEFMKILYSYIQVNMARWERHKKRSYESNEKKENPQRILPSPKSPSKINASILYDPEFQNNFLRMYDKLDILWFDHFFFPEVGAQVNRASLCLLARILTTSKKYTQKFRV
ncbi:hypothetical protein RFI_24361 [Reticulomyxa filosa]|uniref:Uncharacterized protein n=1 Tax=Reticulomyxa filosa TaxID=46433 RepID=X6MGK4_RETFI|nr:hypothetical protein RFI_24361 [Reticulomyxa filosa]|eukprot:ETO13014.1 hypothetical protein RFI_24361 [Reticulomyxa filosa]